MILSRSSWRASFALAALLLFRTPLPQSTSHLRHLRDGSTATRQALQVPLHQWLPQHPQYPHLFSRTRRLRSTLRCIHNGRPNWNIGLSIRPSILSRRVYQHSRHQRHWNIIVRILRACNSACRHSTSYLSRSVYVPYLFPLASARFAFADLVSPWKASNPHTCHAGMWRLIRGY